MRSAEAQLHQASANIGVAVANQLPQFSITGTLGSSALGGTRLFSAGTGFWSLAGAVSQTLFDAGALEHRKRAAVAAYDESAARYRSTVIAASRMSPMRSGRCKRTPIRSTSRCRPNRQLVKAWIWPRRSSALAPWVT
ncbi:TolC family protein [Pseudomonas sp. PCH446]